MANQIWKARTSGKADYNNTEKLFELIMKNNGIARVDARAELRLGVNEMNRAHSGLLAKHSYCIEYKKGSYWNKIKNKQETLGV